MIYKIINFLLDVIYLLFYVFLFTGSYLLSKYIHKPSLFIITVLITIIINVIVNKYYNVTKK